MKSTQRTLALFVPFTLSSILFLTGCGAGVISDPPVTPPPVTTVSVLVSGKVLAGTQPVAGASVQIYSAGASGNGAGASALLATPVTTDATGAFAITSGLTCSSATPMVYLVARGGKVGVGATNDAIALAAAVGDCTKLSTTTTTAFTVNEVTTVAFTWALSQFLSTGGNVGASSTNALGLANAFATAANLVDASQGKAPGATFPSTSKSPAPKINSLANMFNGCVAATGASACNSLFGAMTGSSPAPSNTLDAAFWMARNPGVNVAGLYSLSVSSTAFTPVLSFAPYDWTIAINFTGGGMNAPTGIGVDSQGNIWVASYWGGASKFTPTGSPVFASGITGNGLQSSFGLAIDSQNNVWIPNGDSAAGINGKLGSVTVLNSNGQAISGPNGYISGGLNFPVAVALDTNGTASVLNFRNSRVTQLSSAGTPLSGATGYGAQSMAFIVSIAIDSNHNAWIGNQNDETVTRLSADGTQSLGVSCCSGPQGLAIDQRGYIWASNFYADSVSQISSAGTVVSPGYTGGGLTKPQGIAVDGSGSVWVASRTNVAGIAYPALTQFAGSATTSPGKVLSPASGWLLDGGMLQPYSIAIDASGNVWVTNFTNDAKYANSNSIVELVGMAAPVKTPVIGPPQAP
ncbi:MAG: NHL repeat-containing protein [Acidobacteria bacterium]|nr:NHL repeat-containing protein [Acidobacteriota bacterium]